MHTIRDHALFHTQHYTERREALIEQLDWVSPDFREDEFARELETHCIIELEFEACELDTRNMLLLEGSDARLLTDCMGIEGFHEDSAEEWAWLWDIDERKMHDEAHALEEHVGAVIGLEIDRLSENHPVTTLQGMEGWEFVVEMMNQWDVRVDIQRGEEGELVEVVVTNMSGLPSSNDLRWRCAQGANELH